MRFKLAPTLAVIASGMMFPATYAEEQSLAIEEVVVTARKQEESSQDVPIAMTAISEQLENC